MNGHVVRTVGASHTDSAPGAPALGPDQVHVWVVSLDPQAVAASHPFTATTGVERDRAARFTRRKDAERYLIAHGALRSILAGYLTCDPLAIRFGVRENGKPYVEDGWLEFNLSHSDALALVGVARGRRVGVDIEAIRPIPDLEHLVSRICTADELATLAGLEARQRERAFFAMWTRKEALGKATGEGIGGVFRDARGPEAKWQGGWTVAELTDLPGYAACVAAEGSGWKLVRRVVAESR